MAQLIAGAPPTAGAVTLPFPVPPPLSFRLRRTAAASSGSNGTMVVWSWQA